MGILRANDLIALDTQDRVLEYLRRSKDNLSKFPAVGVMHPVIHIKSSFIGHIVAKPDSM